MPGNLTELLRAFDVLPVLPEINALQSGMRGKSREYIALAEKLGHSEDVCTYVKCDIGMLKSGNIGPTGERLPEPDLLLLSYTGCFTFMKWFELLREEYDCPVVMLHVPYQGDGAITASHAPVRRASSSSEKVIPALEKISGQVLRRGPAEGALARSARPRTTSWPSCESAKNRPSPIDAYFGGVYYIGPIFTAFRGTRGGRATTTRRCARRWRSACGWARAPSRPTASSTKSATALVVEGPPNWTSFRAVLEDVQRRERRSSWPRTYTKVGGIYDFGLPPRPRATRSRRWPTTAWAATRT